MRFSPGQTITLVGVALALLVAAALGGTGAAIAIGIIALPPIAWAFDNASGTFLVLATLLVLAIGVMVLLIALMAISH